MVNPSFAIPVYQVNTAWYDGVTHPNDPVEDAKRLHKAIAGLGTDEKTLIKILGNRNKQQLYDIAMIYGKKKKNSLEKDLKGDCSGNFLALQLELIKPIMTVKLDTLKKAMDGIGTREKALIDVLCLAHPQEMIELKRLFNGNLESRVKSETSGDLKKLLERLIEGKRMPYTMMDPNMAEKVAKDLYDAGERRFGTDDSVFIKIFTTYPPEFLQLVDAHYMRRYGHSLRNAVEKETSGDYKLALIACMTPPWDYYAERLYTSMHGVGTDDKALIYIFSILNEWQLKYISKIFHDKFHKHLKDMIRDDCSGHYKDLLLELC
jgi:annexin A7/11